MQSPINKDSFLEEFIQCKDHTVSNEIFSLNKDLDSGLLITAPQPELQELAKYYESDDYISHTDANSSFFDKIYQIAKNYAIKKKVKLINNLQTNNQSLLDIGCGTGDFVLACAKQNWNVVGVEPNKKAIDHLYSKLDNFNSTNEIELFDSIDKIVNKQYDIITMWHVLEHIPNLKSYISQLKKLLTPNGVLLIAVPNYNSFDAKHYKEFWAAYDVPRHLWHFSQLSIQLLFEKESMEVKKTIPMKLDAFYVSLLSEKYKTGNSNPFSAFLIGLRSNWKAKRTNEYSSLIYCIKNQ